MDNAYNALNLNFKNLLFLLSQVISVTEAAIIVDVGLITLSTDQSPPSFKDYPEAAAKLSEEHISIPNNGCVNVGDKLMLIPGHCCTTVNLHDYIYLTRVGKVVRREPVTSRGKSV